MDRDTQLQKHLVSKYRTDLESQETPGQLSSSSKFPRSPTRADEMSNYSPAYPNNVQVDPGVKDFITKFYGVSDTPGKNQEWLDFFHDDATLVMALQEASGKTGESWRMSLSSRRTAS